MLLCTTWSRVTKTLNPACFQSITAVVTQMSFETWFSKMFSQFVRRDADSYLPLALCVFWSRGKEGRLVFVKVLCHFLALHFMLHYLISTPLVLKKGHFSSKFPKHTYVSHWSDKQVAPPLNSYYWLSQRLTCRATQTNIFTLHCCGSIWMSHFNFPFDKNIYTAALISNESQLKITGCETSCVQCYCFLTN